MSTWDWLARLVRYWPKMEAIITERDAGPWIYMLNEKTIDEFVPSWLRGT